ncbi:DNA-binding response regulator [Chitinophaga sedimenti]|uniref:response regulator transcription factor n=1 Tax=Chitinophaga sedimenti TaxID=2033606 RepID=UPI002005770F|nr:DNA-binding response regulator [Chitinophaga sedimenti]MCK7559050.1 DNA-binding response regulator [Chitinophaga sedimenti]
MQNPYIPVVEDERLVAENVASILAQAGYPKVWLADTSQAAIDYAQKYPVNLLICDIQLHGQLVGTSIVEQIKNFRQVAVIYLTAHSDQQTLDMALATEPVAYLLKPFTDRQLLVAVKMGLRTQVAVPGADSLPGASAREIEIIQCLAEGMSSSAIAQKLNISENTVNTHRRNLLKKYDLERTSEMVAIAIKQKWIKL